MDYVGNTDKSKEVERKPEKVIEKVVTGEVIQKKKGIGRKFKEIFLGDNLKNAGRFVVADVVFPALRNLLYDSLVRGGGQMIYGDSSSRRGRRPEMSGRVQYNRTPIYSPRDPREVTHLPDQPPYRQQGYHVRRRDEDIILGTRTDAERVVETMSDVIENYNAASLADLNSMLGLPVTPIDNKWGWYSIKGTEIRQVRDGYLVELPPLEEIR